MRSENNSSFFLFISKFIYIFAQENIKTKDKK